MTNKKLNEKIFKNALIAEQITKLSTEDKREVVLRLIENTSLSERELAKEIGVAHTTFHGWKTMKANDKKFTYMNLNNIFKKIHSFELKNEKDYLTLKKIKTVVDRQISKFEKNKR